MEINDLLNNFFSTPLFSVLTIIAVVLMGIIIRITLIPANPEYKHKPDRE